MANTPPNQRITTELAYYANLWPKWNTTPSKFGLSTNQAALVKDATAAAQAAYDEAQAARKAAKDATEQQNQAMRAMRSAFSDDISIIKSFITASGDNTLWAAAGLTPPATPGTIPNPTAPFDLTGALDSEGNMTIRWKSRQPSGAAGTVYNVYRTLDGGDPVVLDTVGPRSFVDTTLPLGTRTVAYFIKAKRAGKSSPPSAVLSLSFGRASNGAVRITSAKLAA